MNNDSSPTLPAHPRLLLSQQADADAEADTNATQPPIGRHQENASPDVQEELSPSQQEKEGFAKKLQFLVNLTVNLDTLVYAELCILYYMDCSFFRLFVRWLAQMLFVSPKTEDTILMVPNYHVSAVVAPNLLCMLSHLVSPLPEAGEAARGYLHGGILVDFVGQKPPSSKLTLLGLDIVILALQCFMITVNMSKERVKRTVKPSRITTASGVSVQAVQTTQDHDAEERGLLREAPIMGETDDIEMRDMGEANEHGDASRGLLRGGQGTAAARRRTTRQDDHDTGDLGDALRSGTAVLAQFHVPHSLRSAWHSRENTPETAAAYALQNVGYNATLAALAAQRRARLVTRQTQTR
ncbi:DUF1746-domain-containing protein [Xylariaceae sp. FL1272]|nr:DUF1746-domain-containing protein [Xylariaceae sp. FL1272]